MKRRAPKESNWTEVGKFVDASLKKLGVSQAVKKLTLEDSLRAWVGESGAKYLARVTLKKGIVTVEVTHPAWLQELSTRQGELLKFAQERFKDLKIREAKVTLAHGGRGPRA